MRFVYLVYDECHGLVGVYESEASADRKVIALAEDYDLDTSEAPLDFNSPWRWGWEGCAWWVKEEVLD